MSFILSLYNKILAYACIHAYELAHTHTHLYTHIRTNEHFIINTRTRFHEFIVYVPYIH